MNITSAITPIEPTTAPRTVTPVERQESWYDRAKKTPRICHRLRNEFVKWYQLAWRENMETIRLTNKFLDEAYAEGWDPAEIRQCICSEDFIKLLKEKDPRFMDALNQIDKSCGIVEEPSPTLDLMA